MRFTDIFPELDGISVEVEEFDREGKSIGKRLFDMQELQESIHCSNPNCRLGGLEIGWPLRRLIRQRIEQKEISDICRGYNGDPEAIPRPDICGHSFLVNISAKYKNAKNLISIPIQINSQGANHAILHGLIQNSPDSQGHTHFRVGDTRKIAEGASIRYDHQAFYESEAPIEPIYFTILVSLTTGTAAGVLANYIWKNIEPHLPKIRSLSIGGKDVKPTESNVAKAFLEEIRELEDDGGKLLDEFKKYNLGFTFELDKATQTELLLAVQNAGIRHTRTSTASELPSEAPVTIFLQVYAEVLATLALLYQIIKDRKEKKFKVKITKPDGTKIETDDIDEVKKLLDKEK